MEALWSQFEGVMSAKGGDNEEEEDGEKEGGGGGGGGEDKEIDQNKDKKGKIEGAGEEQDGNQT